MHPLLARWIAPHTRIVCAVLALSAGGASAAPPSTAADAARALSLYKQGKYAAACPLIRKVAEAKATDGAAWADLGLCELKRGDNAASVRASHLAVRYGDERTRKNAYFNLFSAGHQVELPSVGTCAAVACQPGLVCGPQPMPIWACVLSYGYSGNTEASTGALAVFIWSEGKPEDLLQMIQEDAGGAAEVIQSSGMPHVTLDEATEVLSGRHFFDEVGKPRDPPPDLGPSEKHCAVVVVDPAGRVGYHCTTSGKGGRSETGEIAVTNFR